MDDNTASRIVTGVLERTTNILGAQQPEQAMRLMMTFIDHAAHIAAAMADGETVASLLHDLAEHMKVCEHPTIVESMPGDAPYAVPTSTTKH